MDTSLPLSFHVSSFAIGSVAFWGMAGFGQDSLQSSIMLAGIGAGALYVTDMLDSRQLLPEF